LGKSEYVLKKKNPNNTFLQFIKFGIIGISNTLISLIIYYIFILINNNTLMAMAGQSTGWIISIFTGFLLNKKYTFKASREIWWKALTKMYIGYALSLAVSLALTFVQIELLDVSPIIAPIVNLVITIPLNFFITKYWSFRDGGKKNENSAK